MAQPSRSALTAGTAVVGFILQIVPSAYITLTGHAPMWARIWMGAWLGIWALVTVANSARTNN